MVLRGLTLENSDEGMRMYLLGEGFSDVLLLEIRVNLDSVESY